jgi:hypothetical protein
MGKWCSWAPSSFFLFIAKWRMLLQSCCKTYLGKQALVETRSWGTKQQCQNLVPTRASDTKLVPKALVDTKFWHCSVVLQDHHSTSEGSCLISLINGFQQIPLQDLQHALHNTSQTLKHKRIVYLYPIRNPSKNSRCWLTPRVLKSLKKMHK